MPASASWRPRSSGSGRVRIPQGPEGAPAMGEPGSGPGSDRSSWRIAEGKQVRLEYDQDRQAKYGRILAYVYMEDGTFLNAEIIRQGFGFAHTRSPFKYLEEVRKLDWERGKLRAVSGAGKKNGMRRDRPWERREAHRCSCSGC
ncbi:MAG: thermonuclease family protein [Gemmatimonadetes bacterium]|nr:thermonuclease family protein [Gemmatimonadota bacterium]